MGNEKGGGFEREQCRYLSLWWTGGERDDVFWRNRTRATSKSPDVRHQLGDIVAVDPVGAPFVSVFNVELKTGYSKTKKGKRVKNIPWDVLDIIDGKGDLETKVLIQFWQQACRDAELSNRTPMLICKRDYHRPIVCVSKSDLHIFSDYCGGIAFPTIEVKILLPFDYSLVLAEREAFFEWLTPNSVKVICKEKTA